MINDLLVSKQIYIFDNKKWDARHWKIFSQVKYILFLWNKINISFSKLIQLIDWQLTVIFSLQRELQYLDQPRYLGHLQ